MNAFNPTALVGGEITGVRVGRGGRRIEMLFGATIALQHPIATATGVVTEVRLRAAAAPPRKRPRRVTEDVWDLANMVGVRREIVSGMAEVDALAIIRAWHPFADAAVGALNAIAKLGR
jgi:hypothetical protein